MPVNASQILVPAKAQLWLSDVGTTAPTDVTTTPGAGWLDVGLLTTDSLQFTIEPQFEEVTSMQSSYPTRRFQTSESGTVAAVLQQWNEHNMRQSFGGGRVEETSVTGVFRYTPPLLGTRPEVQAMLHIEDGLKKYRFIFPRAQQVEGSEIAFNKGGNSNLNLSLSILGGDDVPPFYILSNDPAFDPA
jgi:hypothetical protein